VLVVVVRQAMQGCDWEAADAVQVVVAARDHISRESVKAPLHAPSGILYAGARLSATWGLCGFRAGVIWSESGVSARVSQFQLRFDEV